MVFRHIRVILGEHREVSDISIKKLFEQHNIEVYSYDNGIDVIRRSFEKKPDLLFLDVSLPLLNGNQIAKILKNDPSMSSTPIILMSSSNEPIEKYWGSVCGGDDFLHKPIHEKELVRILHLHLDKKKNKSRLLTPPSTIPNLDDKAILSLLSNIWEKELLRAKILNELNMIDIHTLPTRDIVMAIMTVFDSLYSFDLGMAFLLYDHYGHIYFYLKEQEAPKRLDNMKSLIMSHLQRQHKMYLDSKQIEHTLLLSANQNKIKRGTTGDVYMFSKNICNFCAVLAFENSRFGDIQEEDQEILGLAQNVLEKKILFESSQTFSIIDTVTGHGSIVYFMACLKREMTQSIRKGYPITLITIVIANFKSINQNLSIDEAYRLIRIIENLILEIVRKSDIVARWEMASFAVLQTGIPLENIDDAKQRICNYLIEKSKHYLPKGVELALSTGICQFDDEGHKDDPEMFFKDAQPKDVQLKDTQAINLQPQEVAEIIS